MKYEDEVFGTVEFSELEKKIIENPGMQRLKGIHSGGVRYLIYPHMDITRFEHSIGTAIICKRFSEKQEESIAGLVHDISHTAFSHMIDQVYERKDQSFHEDHHHRFLEEYGLNRLMEEQGHDPNHILNPNNFTILEKKIPDMCADRLDYTLRALYKDDLIDKETIQRILKGITVENGFLVAKNKEEARRIMELSIKLNTEIFFEEKQEAAQMLMKELLLQALNKNILTEEDFFKTDEEVMKKLRENKELSQKLVRINPTIETKRTTKNSKHRVMRKHRIMDPVVKNTGKRISQIDPETKKKLTEFKENTPTEVKYEIKTQPF